MRALVVAVSGLLVFTALACTGAAPDTLSIADAGIASAPAAQGPVADAGPDGAAPERDAGLDAASALDAFAVRCVPRQSAEAGTPCQGSYQCPIGALCCGADGQSFGRATGACSTGPCGGPTPVQLCTATCECLQGACNNVWPYEVHGSCR